jgi:hypothetical protein
VPLTEPEWQSIGNFVERIVRRVAGTKADYFVTGKVLKVDKPNKCIYMSEFGDQPIPVVGFDYEIDYYDTTATGVVKKTAPVKLIMPSVGDSVLVARELGVPRMPRCLGVIQGTNWIIPGED